MSFNVFKWSIDWMKIWRYIDWYAVVMLSTIAAVLTHVRTLPQQFHLSRCNIENGIRINDYKRIKFILTLCWFLIFVLIRFWCYAAVFFLCVCVSVSSHQCSHYDYYYDHHYKQQVYASLFSAIRIESDEKRWWWGWRKMKTEYRIERHQQHKQQ